MIWYLLIFLQKETTSLIPRILSISLTTTWNNINIYYILSTIKNHSQAVIFCAVICVCMSSCVFPWMKLHLHFYIHACEDQTSISGVFLSWSLSYCLRQGLPLNLDLNNLPKVADQQASGTLLIDLTKNTDYRGVPPHQVFHTGTRG